MDSLNRNGPANQQMVYGNGAIRFLASFGPQTAWGSAVNTAWPCGAAESSGFEYYFGVGIGDSFVCLDALAGMSLQMINARKIETGSVTVD